MTTILQKRLKKLQLRKLPMEKRTYQVCLDAVKRDFLEFTGVPQYFRSKEICDIVVFQEVTYMKYVPLMLYEEVAQDLIRNKAKITAGMNIGYPVNMVSLLNRGFLSSYPFSMNHLATIFGPISEKWKKISKNCNLDGINEYYKQVMELKLNRFMTPALCLELLDYYITDVGFFPKKSHTPEVVLKALLQNPYNIKYFLDVLNEEVCLQAVNAWRGSGAPCKILDVLSRYVVSEKGICSVVEKLPKFIVYIKQDKITVSIVRSFIKGSMGCGLRDRFLDATYVIPPHLVSYPLVIDVVKKGWVLQCSWIPTKFWTFELIYFAKFTRDPYVMYNIIMKLPLYDVEMLENYPRCVAAARTIQRWLKRYLYAPPNGILLVKELSQYY